MRFRRLIAVLAASFLVMLPAPADGAFPGVNGRIAFTRVLTTGVSQIFTAAPDGSTLSNLSNNPAVDDCTPSYSRDGRLIAFERGADCVGGAGGAITVMYADGSNQRQITTPPAGSGDAQPHFSADGRQIVFERFDSGGNEALFVVNVDGSGVHQLVTPPAGFGDETPRWSPDGARIAFMREPTDDSGGQIMVINANGTGSATAVSNPPAMFKDGDPNWSPDGSKIAFGRSQAAELSAASNVIVVDVATHVETPLTTDSAGTLENEDPAFSPDGKLIVYGHHDDTANTGQIFAMNADGSGNHAITQPVAAQLDYEPDWGAPPQPPVLTGLTVAPARPSTVGRRVKGKCVAQTSRNKHDKKCRRSVKLTVRYTLDFSSTVAFRLTRSSPGRKVAGKCVKQTNRNMMRKRCTLITTVRGISGPGAAGANSFTLDAKALGPGSYRLTATPTAIGKTGSRHAARFTILD